jgi:hypothetical protein
VSESNALTGIYAEVGANYRAIDEQRLRLLGLLPLATGTGIFLLLRPGPTSGVALVGAGVFGVLATFSLFFYELHGVEKCAHFIHRGAQIEESLGIRGSFTMRPHKMFVVSELLPSEVIYPASLAGWVYVALEGFARDGSPKGSPHTVLGLESTHLAAAVLVVATVAAYVLVQIREDARGQEWDREDELCEAGTWPRQPAPDGPLERLVRRVLRRRRPEHAKTRSQEGAVSG